MKKPIVFNFKGIQAYIDLLFSGGGKASKTGGPMGPQFFLKTGAKCKDIDSGEQVTRSIYINTIPLENTGVLSGFNSTFGGAQGFVYDNTERFFQSGDKGIILDLVEEELKKS